MAVRNAEAVWEGNLKEGHGDMKVGSGAFEVPYSYQTRFEEEPGTNPEELVGAAHAGCFSMYLSAVISGAGHTVKRIHTTARVHLGAVDGAPTITKIELDTQAEVPGLDEASFMEHAEASKKGCPVSKALAGPEIVLNAKLIS